MMYLDKGAVRVKIHSTEAGDVGHDVVAVHRLLVDEPLRLFLILLGQLPARLTAEQAAWVAELPGS
jgi:hypothetical protein